MATFVWRKDDSMMGPKWIAEIVPGVRVAVWRLYGEPGDRNQWHAEILGHCDQIDKRQAKTLQQAKRFAEKIASKRIKDAAKRLVA